jgi:hypothetical protein
MIIGNSGAIFLMKNNCFLPDSFVGRVYFCILKIFLKNLNFIYFKLIFFDVLKLF